MSYQLNFVATFPVAGLTLNAKLYDAAASQVGVTITSGFVDHGDRSYSYLATIPNGHVGTFVVYDSTQPTRAVRFSINPQEAENSASILSGVNSLVSTVGAAGAGLTALPGMVWGNSVRTLSSFGTLVADVAAAVWGYATRTLTIATAQLPASVQGSTATIIRAVTFGATFGSINIPASWSKIYFTVKANNQYADDQAIVQVVKSDPSAGGDGLIRLNRAAATANTGALVIDQPGGAVTVQLTDDATAQLNYSDCYYDIKALLADGSSVLLAQGVCLIRLTSTHTI